MNPEALIEAALLTSSDPMSDRELRALFTPALGRDAFNDIMETLARRWKDRALSLVEDAQGWHFAVAGAAMRLIPHLYEERKPRHSRALSETLAIIAYRQPVTRGQIEEIRGIAVSSQVMQTLSERDWIEIVGHKDSPGKPALWATTGRFLHDFRLRDLSELPPEGELGSPDEEEPIIPET